MTKPPRPIVDESRTSCPRACDLCGRAIVHGRSFFRLSQGRTACVRCVEERDLYDALPHGEASAALAAVEWAAFAVIAGLVLVLGCGLLGSRRRLVRDHRKERQR